MLTEDVEQPYLATALSQRRMEELLSERVLPTLWPGQRLTAFKLHHTRYKAGKECVVLYSFRTDADSAQPGFATFTFARPERLQKAYAHDENGHARPAPPHQLLLPEYPCLVECFPADWKLPHLAWAADRLQMADVLARAMANGATPRPAPVLDIQVLRYIPNRRCVLRYVVDTPSGRQEVIAKVYRQRERAEEVRRKLDSLHQQAAGSAVAFPKPLGVIDQRPVLFMEKAPGTSLAYLLEQGTSGSEAHRLISTAAAGLAAFHRLRFDAEPKRSPVEQLQALRRRVESLRVAAPQLAGRIDALLAQLGAVAARTRRVVSALVHGDYKPSQLLLHDGRVAILDLDRAAPGDPAADVGNFLAVLRKKALIEGQPHLAELGEHFLEQYRAHAQVEGLAERACLFQAIALVRAVVRRFERSPLGYVRRGDDWLPLQLLEEAAACLAQR